MAFDLPEAAHGCVWIHACSVGEVASVAPLIRSLAEKGIRLHLTVVTHTGFRHAMQLFSSLPGFSLSYLPWDLPGLMRRLTKRLQPSLLLLTETEFWPGMLNACKRLSIPVIGINTRISDRSFPRYLRTRKLWRRWLSPVVLFLAQSDIDKTRLEAIGIEPARIQALGNLKYAISPPAVDAKALRQKLDPSEKKPIFVAGSTHADEEAQLLQEWQTWKQACPELLLVIVPRHPERFEQVAGLLEAQQLRFIRWSELTNSDNPSVDIVLIDAMGVLQNLYAIADLAFIGGSLADKGGHNPLEAAICGRGAITGPHVQNFREIMQQMQHVGAAVITRNSEELHAAVLRLLAHPEELRELHARASTFMHERSAVLGKVLDAIKPYLAKAGHI